MADPPTAAKTKVAVTRKHLRRDQAAARKARSTVLPGSDTVKERQVVSLFNVHIDQKRYSLQAIPLVVT